MVSKTLQIDGKDFDFSANGVTPIIYKQVFRSDLFKDFMNLSDDGAGFYEIITQLAYILNKSAEGLKFSEMKYDAYIEWLSAFSSTAFMDEDLCAEIADIWTSSEETKSKPKK